MDHPIIVDEAKFPLKEAVSLFQRIHDALWIDDKDEFLRLVRDPEFEQARPEFDFLAGIYRYDALEIGIAVFNGETKGIIEPEDVLPQGITQLHFVAAMGSPKLTKYFLERGDNVDILCDFQGMNMNMNLNRNREMDIKYAATLDLVLHSINMNLNMKQATPLDLALESIVTGQSALYTNMERPWSTSKSIFELLVYLCRNRRRLETLRLLVQNTSNRERVKQAFIDYANNGQLVQLSALFMAVPDLFLSYNVSLGGALPSIGILYLELNNLEKRTDIEEALLLLLDVFTIIGDKLVAFIRLEEYEDDSYNNDQIIAFLLDEVAHKKLGVSSPDDYYLRFFKPVRPEADQLAENSSRIVNHNDTLKEYPLLSYNMKRKDITIHYINRFRSKSPKYEEAALLCKAIDNKLSSMSTFHRLFEPIGEIPMKEKKYLPQWFPLVCSITFKPSVLSFHSVATRTKPWINHKFTPLCLENKAMRPTKLTSFFSFAKLIHFSMIAKSLIK